MTQETTHDWNPGAYERFRGLRLQPALDLLARVGELPDGPVVDLGCGAGVMGDALKARFPTRLIAGVDNSPAMLAKASDVGSYNMLQEADIAAWQPDTAPALIFSNAALQWLDDHPTLLRHLAGILPPGGVLAVQMPHQNPAASHVGWDKAFEALFGKPLQGQSPSVLHPETYYGLLEPLGEVNLWQTEYFQHLAASDKGHPVRLFTQSTYARPFVGGLDKAGQQRLIEAYEADISRAYSLRPDGSCLFPFRRLFFTLRVL